MCSAMPHKKEEPGIHSRAQKKAFTLVELIVVVAIIGILSTLVIVRYAGKTDQAKVAAAKAHLQQFEGAVIEFQANCNRLPRSLDELIHKPSDCPNWQEGGYLKGSAVPKDPWGNDYIYKVDGSNFEIICLGSDGKEGGTGTAADISSLHLNDGGK